MKKKQFKWNQLTILTMTNTFYEANYFIPCLRGGTFLYKNTYFNIRNTISPTFLGEQLVENCSFRPILSVGRSLLLD